MTRVLLEKLVRTSWGRVNTIGRFNVQRRLTRPQEQHIGDFNVSYGTLLAYCQRMKRYMEEENGSRAFQYVFDSDSEKFSPIDIHPLLSQTFSFIAQVGGSPGKDLAMTLREVNLRIIPTSKHLTNANDDPKEERHFDQAQEQVVPPGEVMRVLGVEVFDDRRFAFVRTTNAVGFIEINDDVYIAASERQRQSIINYQKQQKVAVVKKPSLRIPRMGLVRFGTVLSIVDEKVAIPYVENGIIMTTSIGEEHGGAFRHGYFDLNSEIIVDLARSFIDKDVHYGWGDKGIMINGKEHIGYDCSGLFLAIVQACGVRVFPRNAGRMIELMTKVQGDKKQVGDLVLWNGHAGVVSGINENGFSFISAIDSYREKKSGDIVGVRSVIEIPSNVYRAWQDQTFGESVVGFYRLSDVV